MTSEKGEEETNFSQSYDNSSTTDMTAFRNTAGDIVTRDGKRLIPGPDGVHFMIDPRDVYEFIKLLGKGTYARVFHARHKLTKAEFAIKILDIAGNTEELKAFEKEIRILQEGGDSPFMVKLIETYQFKNEIWIVMELCECGSLESFLKYTPHGTFSEAETAAAVKMLLFGLLHLHSRKKIHRDVKAANVLVNANGQLKIADFGLSAILEKTLDNAKSLCGTPYFVAPEICLNKPYDRKADVWSLGILTYMLLVGQVPIDLRPLQPVELIQFIPNSTAATYQLPGKPENYRFTSQTEVRLLQYYQTTGSEFAPGEGWSSSCRDFLRCCFQHDPARRWDVTELLMHNFIFQVPRLISQPTNASAEAGDDITSENQAWTADLVILPPPQHRAWPGSSTRRPPQANIRAYLSTDDGGSGASIILSSLTSTILPILEQQARPKLLSLQQVEGFFRDRCQGNIIQYYRGHNQVAEQQLRNEALMRRYNGSNRPGAVDEQVPDNDPLDVGPSLSN